MADKPQEVVVVDQPIDATAHPSSKAETRKATNAAIDAAAGAPAPMREAAEALPEKDAVEKAHKDKLLADDAQSEAKANAKLVELSPNSADTPSGGAMLKVAGIADDVERGLAYEREKHARRTGYVPADKS